ncbi:MAG: SDR family oxidoreductase [Dermatophilaceae bacterium]
MPGHTLDGSVVAVIGASGALGSLIARELADRGARLVLAGRDPDRLAAVGIAGAVTVLADLTDASAGDRIVEAAQDGYGRLDGVVNAAGVVAFGPLVDTEDIVVEELFMTNVIGPLWMIRRVAPALAETGGFVCNVSAVVAEQPLPGMVPYAATKAALTAADGALARELRRMKVSVIDARPPHTETGLADRPLAGAAPRMPRGLEPQVVARRIVQAIEAGESDVGSAAFG